ncbi:MAG: FecR family protein [Sulfuricella sp.]|nr:FecR family protein [Sulfuricella sp.]
MKFLFFNRFAPEFSPTVPHTSLPETTNDDPQAQAARWVARRHGGEHSSEDQQAFLRWLNTNEANRKAFEEAEALWQQLGGLDAVTDRQLAEARAYLLQARRRPVPRRALAFTVAASLMAALVWSADWLSYLDDQIYRTAQGERKTVTLADGSRLDLNTNTELAVHLSRRGRELKLLRGEAVFTVAHGDTRPFEVFAGNGRVRDIGTQFDVRTHTDRISVAVLEGTVEVSGRDSGIAQTLRQGQQLSYSLAGDATPVTLIDTAAAAAWREGRLAFNSQPLAEILAELGRYHSATVIVTSSQILNTKVSGSIPIDDFGLALRTLAATLPARLTQTGPQSWRIDG